MPEVDFRLGPVPSSTSSARAGVVQFSGALTAQAEGVNIPVSSSSTPTESEQALTSTGLDSDASARGQLIETLSAAGTFFSHPFAP